LVARRRLFELIFWPTSLISLAGAIVTFLAEKRAPAQTPLLLAAANIESLMDNVDGATPLETKMMRIYLHKRVAGIAQSQAVAAAGMPKGLERAKLVFSATGQLKSQIAELIAVQTDIIAKKL
jgi:predicted component of type VI protein secretion system